MSALAFSPERGRPGHREWQRQHPAMEPGGLPPAVGSPGRRAGQPGRRGVRAHTAGHVQRRRRPARDQRRARDRPGVGHQRAAAGGRATVQLPHRDRAGPQPGRQDTGRGRQRRAAVADGNRPADRQRAARGQPRPLPGRGVQPGRHPARHARRGRHGPDLERDHPAGNRRADDRRPARCADRGRGVQPQRPDAGHGGRGRPGPAVERGHSAGHSASPWPRARPRPWWHSARTARGWPPRASDGSVRLWNVATQQEIGTPDDRRRPAGLRGSVQPRRRHAGHRRRRRQRPALGRGHPARDRHAR